MARKSASRDRVTDVTGYHSIDAYIVLVSEDNVSEDVMEEVLLDVRSLLKLEMDWETTEGTIGEWRYQKLRISKRFRKNPYKQINES